jgi:hypothetical protein
LGAACSEATDLQAPPLQARLIGTASKSRLNQKYHPAKLSITLKAAKAGRSDFGAQFDLGEF